MTPYRKVANLGTYERFTSYLDELGIEIPVDAQVDPDGVLSTPVEIRDATAGVLTAPNRFAALPMEGWDGTTDGRPTDLVRRRWTRIAEGGSGLVWCEASAVRPDGRANPNQLVLDATTVDDIASLRAVLDPAQVAGLQLTHSGRWSRPGAEMVPRTAYAHPILDARQGIGAEAVFTDDELDELAATYVGAAVLASEAGFDFVDVKHCHGYLLHELLSAVDRPGRYGGDLEGRTHFLRTVVSGIRERAPRIAVAVRLSVFDLRPFTAGEHGTGVPDGDGDYRYAFGGDGTGLGIDLTEAHAMLDLCRELGIGLVSTTAGSPYYVPHVQRPAYFPPSDGYLPPEDPLVGVARQLAATRELTQGHPDLVIVGSAYSYLQEWLPNVAQAVIASGGATMAGLGRMLLAYPDLPRDVLGGATPQRGRICRTFSDCTTAPRNGLVSGCYPLDPHYKTSPEREQLIAAKQRVRERLG